MNNPERINCTKMADEIADKVMLTPRLYEAFCEVPRSVFLDIKKNAFSLNPQPINSAQWISSPLTVAKMTMALEAENCDNILEIGCGSGYQAVILSLLAHRIFSVERIENLAKSAKQRIKNLNINNVHIRYDDGNLGWQSYAPYDRILLSCACAKVPENLFKQLKIGGILVAPVGDKNQTIIKFTKTNSTITEKRLENCNFVPLLGGVQ